MKKQVLAIAVLLAVSSSFSYAWQGEGHRSDRGYDNRGSYHNSGGHDSRGEHDRGNGHRRGY